MGTRGFSAGSMESTEESPLIPKKKKLSCKDRLGKRALLMIYCGLLLIVGVGNTIFFKKMSTALINYPYFLTQFTTVVYVPIFFAVVAYQFKFTNWITPAMTNISKFKFFVMGAFDSLSGVLALFGAAQTSGTLQALLNNAIIPITLVCSVVVLQTRFQLHEYLGSGVILLGVSVVVFIPQLMSTGAAVAGSAPNNIMFNIIYFSNVLPGALSAVYKEKIFASIDVEVNYLQAWVALFQLAFGFLLIPLNTFSFLGPNAMPFSQLPMALWQGWLCMCGTNTVLDDCYTGWTPHKDDKPCDECEGAWYPVVMYLFFNCSYNVLIVLIIKHGSAALLFVISTLALPIVQIMFSIRAINDPPDPLSWASLLGMGLIVGGLCLYNGKGGPSEGQEDVMIPQAGRPYLMTAPIRRNIMKHLIKDARQLRGSFYAKIGVISSPPTPHTYRHSPASSVRSEYSESWGSRAGTPSRNTPRLGPGGR